MQEVKELVVVKGAHLPAEGKREAGMEGAGEAGEGGRGRGRVGRY